MIITSNKKYIMIKNIYITDLGTLICCIIIISINSEKKLRTPLSRGSSLCEGMREGYCTQPCPYICKGCFRSRTHDQQVTKTQLYRCTRARPHLNQFRKKKKKTTSHSQLWQAWLAKRLQPSCWVAMSSVFDLVSPSPQVITSFSICGLYYFYIFIFLSWSPTTSTILFNVSLFFLIMQKYT